MQAQRLLRRRLRRFSRNVQGTAAIEFAFVAGPFLFMMFAVIELALVFLLSTSLEAASDGAARRIRTGQFQNANQTAADFKTKVCEDMSWFASRCSTSLIVRTKTYTSYAAIQADTTFADPIQPSTSTSRQAKPDSFPATKIAPQTIVVVRSYYKWPLITPFLNGALQKLDNGVALISSTQAFRTEPYE